MAKRVNGPNEQGELLGNELLKSIYVVTHTYSWAKRWLAKNESPILLNSPLDDACVGEKKWI